MIFAHNILSLLELSNLLEPAVGDWLVLDADSQQGVPTA